MRVRSRAQSAEKLHIRSTRRQYLQKKGEQKEFADASLPGVRWFAVNIARAENNWGNALPARVAQYGVAAATEAKLWLPRMLTVRSRRIIQKQMSMR